MLIFIFWFVFSIFVGKIATKKGRNGFGWFVISFLLSPILGLMAVLILEPNYYIIENDKLASGAFKKCLYCSEIIKKSAIKCRYCGSDLVEEIDL